MQKVLKASLAFLAALFAGAQFVRPARVNPPAAAGQSIEESARVPPEVAEVLNRSCMDCHSNRTNWPWYSNVAPASWVVADHVNHGRRHLNFSEWASYDRREAEDKLKMVCKFSKAGWMPLDSYTLIHRNSRLRPGDAAKLCEWAQAETGRLALSR